MKSRALHELLANLSGAAAAEVDQRIRPLRDKKLISSGPRGIFAVDVTAAEAALMLLSLVPRRANHSLPVVERSAGLKEVKPGSVKAGKRTLGALISGYLEHGVYDGLQAIEITDDGSVAWVRYGTTSLLYTDRLSEVKNAANDIALFGRIGRTGVSRYMVFGAAALRQVQLRLAKRG